MRQKKSSFSHRNFSLYEKYLIYILSRGGSGNQPKKWVEGGSRIRLFFIFLPHLWYSTKCRSTFGSLHFEKSSNFAKNEEKPFSTQLAFNPLYSRPPSQNRILKTRQWFIITNLHTSYGDSTSFKKLMNVGIST